MGLQCMVIGDIGGTQSRLELQVERDGAFRAVHEQTYLSEKFTGFDALLDDFFALEVVRSAASRTGSPPLPSMSVPLAMIVVPVACFMAVQCCSRSRERLQSELRNPWSNRSVALVSCQ